VARCDALIVGGGPAGSTCARILRGAGWNVIVIDRARFPRDKVCAGWVTPGVFELLDLPVDEYRATGLTIQSITGFKTSVFKSRVQKDPAYATEQSIPGREHKPATVGRVLLDPPRPVETRYPGVVSYAIRRCEFDDFLLKRAQVRVMESTPLTSLERRGDMWVANGEIQARVVIGAGGHFCPVARQLRGAHDAVRPVVAKEAEFALDDDASVVAGDVPELFFCEDLEGYAWCVRKGRFLNIGIGRRDKGDLNAHADDFMQFLERTGRAKGASRVRWHGHAYLASGTGPRPLVDDAVMVAGDSAGLAYPQSGEGIRPAVESGRLAAETLVAAGGRVNRSDLEPYAAALRRRYPPARTTPGALASVVTALGRRLMASPAFTRRVVIERWFLRA
jgi:menaquinone-9 beta-reductase